MKTSAATASPPSESFHPPGIATHPVDAPNPCTLGEHHWPALLAGERQCQRGVVGHGQPAILQRLCVGQVHDLSAPHLCNGEERPVALGLTHQRRRLPEVDPGPIPAGLDLSYGSERCVDHVPGFRRLRIPPGRVAAESADVPPRGAAADYEAPAGIDEVRDGRLLPGRERVRRDDEEGRRRIDPSLVEWTSPPLDRVPVAAQQLRERGKPVRSRCVGRAPAPRRLRSRPPTTRAREPRD
ncbi:MAG: hypothetical protein M5T61_06085 [Acidimicrobiia bacterium]|nr:hypothetical protein [Acidimicrobiia bacterium]